MANRNSQSETQIHGDNNNEVVDIGAESVDQVEMQDEDVIIVEGEFNGEAVGRKRKGGAGNKRSVAWNHFTSFRDKKTGKMMAKCNYCKKNLCGDTKNNGTTTLRKHAAKCRQNPNNMKNQTMLMYFGNDGNGDNAEMCANLGTWTFDPVAVVRALAEMIILNEEAFSLVEKIGFKRFCRIAFPPTFTIPSRKTITKHCYDIYIENRSALKKYFKESQQRVSLTTDTWTSVQNITYMSLTAHFVDGCWKLQKKILCFCPVESHKGQELGELLVACLKDWGIEKVYALTVDNASANDGVVRVLKEALNKWGTAVLGGQDLHMRCAAHVVNLIVTEGIKEPKFSKSVANVRSAVRFIRQSPMRMKRFKEACEKEEIATKKLLRLDCRTRWNSLFLMLARAEEFENAFDRYARMDPSIKIERNNGHENDGLGFPTCIDWENTRRVIKFLEPFYEMTDKVSGSLYTTSNIFFPEICEVDGVLNEWNDDVDLSAVAERMREKYNKYWGDADEFNKNLFLAVVLDPRNKMEYLQFLLKGMYGQEKGMEVVEMVGHDFRRLFEEYKRLIDPNHAGTSNGNLSSQLNLSQNVSIDAASDDVASKQRRAQLRRSEFKRFKSDNGSIFEKTEIERYLGDVDDVDDNLDVLTWWKMNVHRFPTLAAMARDVLAVPISTVASESAFSTGGRVLDAFRSSLTPRMAQALICAQDWLRCKEKQILDDEDFDALNSLEQEFERIHLDSTILE